MPLASRLTIDDVRSGPRARLYDLILATPGIHFLGIVTRLAWGYGNTQYHLRVLEKAGLIQAQRCGRFVRYFASGQLTGAAMALLALQRDPVARAIRRAQSTHPSPRPSTIAARLGMTRQAVAHHLRRWSVATGTRSVPTEPTRGASPADCPNPTPLCRAERIDCR